MAGHANPIVRNTAEFFTGPDPVLTVDATTKRSDSPALVAKAPSGYDPRLFDAFFRGVTMDNVHYQETGRTSGTRSASCATRCAGRSSSTSRR